MLAYPKILVLGGDAKKRSSIKTLHLDIIWVKLWTSVKKYTKLVSTKISTLQKGKMKDTTFLGTFSTIWEFSCFRSEKSIEKINIHNVKIWTFRTSSSWENMTHENTHTCNFIQGKGPSFLLCSTCDDECFCYVYTMHHLVFPSKRSTGFSFR